MLNAPVPANATALPVESLPRVFPHFGAGTWVAAKPKSAVWQEIHHLAAPTRIYDFHHQGEPSTTDTSPAGGEGLPGISSNPIARNRNGNNVEMQPLGLDAIASYPAALELALYAALTLTVGAAWSGGLMICCWWVS